MIVSTCWCFNVWSWDLCKEMSETFLPVSGSVMVPVIPASWCKHVVNVGVHINDARVGTHCSSKVVVACPSKSAIHEWKPSWFACSLPVLSCKCTIIHCSWYQCWQLWARILTVSHVQEARDERKHFSLNWIEICSTWIWRCSSNFHLQEAFMSKENFQFEVDLNMLAWIRCSSACIWGSSLDFVVMHKESWSFGLVEKNYHINGLSVSKHEVNGAFNVAILEIVAASVVAESILTSKEATAVECCHVTRYSKSSTLFTISSCWWWRRCILRTGQYQVPTYKIIITLFFLVPLEHHIKEYRKKFERFTDRNHDRNHDIEQRDKRSDQTRNAMSRAMKWGAKTVTEAVL